jgi:hypothetical protein
MFMTALEAQLVFRLFQLFAIGFLKPTNLFGYTKYLIWTWSVYDPELI